MLIEHTVGTFMRATYTGSKNGQETAREQRCDVRTIVDCPSRIIS